MIPGEPLLVPPPPKFTESAFTAHYNATKQAGVLVTHAVSLIKSASKDPTSLKAGKYN